MDNWYNPNKAGSSFWMKGNFDLYSSISHQQSISNFVSILSGKNIPVQFTTDEQSYTNGEEIVIGTEINEDNLDTCIGLALHEASHILLSDFEGLKNYLKKLKYYKGHDRYGDKGQHKVRNPERMKLLINYIEDRRIDRWAYDSSPGYQIYYKSLYNKFFYTETISDALKSQLYTDESWDSYEFRIINILHADNDLKSLKQLGKVYKIMDIDNISRLENSKEVIKLAEEIYDLIDSNVSISNSSKSTNARGLKDQDGKNLQGMGVGGKIESNINAQKRLINGESQVDTTKPSGKVPLNVKPFDDVTGKRTAPDARKLRNFQSTPRVIIGRIDSAHEVNEVVKTSPKLSIVDNYKIASVGVDRKMLNTSKVGNKQPFCFLKGDRINEKSVLKGIILGKKLVKKLEILEEETKEITQYKRKGRLDSKRMIHYQNDNRIFHTIKHYITTCTKVHLSIDMSGSMGGDKWSRTIEMMVALAYCSQKISKFDLTIDGRIDRFSENIGYRDMSKDIFWLLNLYDSKKTKWTLFLEVIKRLKSIGGTPEGILLAQIGKQLHPDTHLFIITDGSPNYSTQAYGSGAVEHTKSVVDKLKRKKHKIHAFYIGSSHRPDPNFNKIYGKNGITIDTQNVNQVARSVNKILLA